MLFPYRRILLSLMLPLSACAQNALWIQGRQEFFYRNALFESHFPSGKQHPLKDSIPVRFPSTSEGPHLWDGTWFYFFGLDETKTFFLQLGEPITSREGRKVWFWQQAQPLPADSKPLAAHDRKVLLVRELYREERGQARLYQGVALELWDVLENKAREVKRIEVKSGEERPQFQAVVKDGDMYCFSSTGWLGRIREGSQSLTMLREDFLGDVEITPSATYWPFQVEFKQSHVADPTVKIQAPPFFDSQGRIHLLLQVHVPGTLEEHKALLESIPTDRRLQWVKRPGWDPLPKESKNRPGSKRQCFGLRFDPEENKLEKLDPEWIQDITHQGEIPPKGSGIVEEWFERDDLFSPTEGRKRILPLGKTLQFPARKVSPKPESPSPPPQTPSQEALRPGKPGAKDPGTKN